MGRPRARTVEITEKVGGSNRSRVENQQDPNVLGDSPRAPVFLSAGAAKIWSLILPGLEERQLVDAIDALTLVQYCEAYSQWQIERKRRKNRNPAEIAKWFDRAFRLAKDLGLSIKARTSITIPSKKDDDGLDALVA